MERLTTDTPKDNLEMALNLFYTAGEQTPGYGSSSLSGSAKRRR